jgi:hypothetical protein
MTSKMGAAMVQVKELIEATMQKTEEGKLQWTGLGDDFYQASIGENSVTIRNQQGFCVFAIRNSEGTIIDKMEAGVHNTADNRLLQQLFLQARRQALRVDQTLEEIKRTLNNL